MMLLCCIVLSAISARSPIASSHLPYDRRMAQHGCSRKYNRCEFAPARCLTSTSWNVDVNAFSKGDPNGNNNRSRSSLRRCDWNRQAVKDQPRRLASRPACNSCFGHVGRPRPSLG